ncbi:MAG: DUF2314 domain-containing protein, partial [Beijerinckiaceae bacterium]
LKDFFAAGAAAQAGESNFVVKMPMTSDGLTENIWVGALRNDPEKPGAFIGRLANEPNMIKGYASGQRIRFTIDEVNDWTYRTAEGAVRGNYTGCAIAAGLGAEAVKQIEAGARLDCSWLRARKILEG